MYTVTQPFHNCILLEFDKQKDLSLTFCRIQEFYESNNANLFNKYFHIDELLDNLMDDDGNITYFSYWNGFNIPGHVIDQWLTLTQPQFHTKWESHLYLELLHQNIDKTKPYYVIGTQKGDNLTIDHELCHALYYLNEPYKLAVIGLVYEFNAYHRDEYNKVINAFHELGYNENVYKDEINAWLTTSTEQELIEEFSLNVDAIRPIRNRFINLFEKYRQ